MGKTVSFLSVALLAASFLFASDANAKKVKTQRPYYSGITFLKFEQVAKLPPNARVQYIREFRNMFVEIEKFQMAFKQAGNAGLNEKQKEDFYAILFGRSAYAQQGECKRRNPDGSCAEHYRGEQCADQCIYAYNLNKYTRKDGKCVGFPFGCSKPPTCKRGGGTLGYLCNESVSGLQGRDACISTSIVRGATRTCEQKRVTLEEQFSKSGNLQKLMQNAEKAFGFESGKVSKEFLKSEKAKEFIDNLIKTRYSDHSYGMLISLMQVYQEAGVPFPSKDPDILNLERNFNSITATLDGVFGNYMRMCDTPLAQDVINDIDQLRNAASGTFNRRLEEARKKELERVRGQGGVATSRNVLQKPECFLVTQRMNKIKRVTDDLGRRLPVASDIAPPATPPVPPAPPSNDSDPVGCSDGGELNNSLIFNRVGRCGLCAMEKSVHNHGDGAGMGEDDLAVERYGEKPRKGHYRVSKKWTALLSTMMKACGISDHASSDVEQFNEMYQTFGHCSEDTYDWDTSDDYLTVSDLDKIQDWGNYNYWNGDGMPPEKKKIFFGLLGTRNIPEPDQNRDFARIFGVSYATATRVFCDPSRFDSPDLMLVQDKKGHTKVKKKKKSKRSSKKSAGKIKLNREAKRFKKERLKVCKEMDRLRDRRQCEYEAHEKAVAISVGASNQDTTSKPSSRLTRMKAGRQRLDYAIDNHYIKGEAPDGARTAARGLESCMEEALDRAEEYYSPEKSDAMCMQTVKVDAKSLKKQMMGDQPPGNVLVSTKDCLVSHQVESHGKKNENTSLAFVSTDVRPQSVQRPSRGVERFYSSTDPIMADPEMARHTLKNAEGATEYLQGLTIDFYAPYTKIYETDRFDTMTEQVSCNKYWGSRDYQTPRPRSQRGNK